MTTRLFDTDSHMKDFTASVVSCVSRGDHFEAELDRTAFFPEGGGQPGDTGTLNGAEVFDTHERGRVIFHYMRTPLEPGTQVSGCIDWKLRFARMQSHSGEHIVSGLAHRLFGYDNVGFHIGADAVTLDFSGELTDADIVRIEDLANEAVWADLNITAVYPSPSELSSMSYRSKLELTENVRIVTVQGIDVCACCAPHVSHTGEIGLIRIVDAMRHRGGMRLTMLAGSAALLDARSKGSSVTAISALLSVKRDEVADGVARLLRAADEQKQAFNEANLELVRFKAEAVPASEGCICLFERSLDPVALRELVNLTLCKAGRAVAGFSGSDGSYRFIIASNNVDLRTNAQAINKAISGKGGGSPSMIQGGCSAARSEIEAFFKAF